MFERVRTKHRPLRLSHLRSGGRWDREGHQPGQPCLFRPHAPLRSTPQDLSRWVPAGLSALRLHRMHAGGRWNQRRWEARHAGDL
jgi:hypothetical protein